MDAVVSTKIDFITEIETMLRQGNIDYSAVNIDGYDIILQKERKVAIILQPTRSTSLEGAYEETTKITNLRETLISEGWDFPIILTEDRYKSGRKEIQKRLYAHLGKFTSVFARNCEVRRIDRKIAAEFLEQHHSYGMCTAKYYYGLYQIKKVAYGHPDCPLVAVAAFSSARRWKKADLIINSHEWVRYASVSGLRIPGGMGKLLKHFINEVKPDDIMSYSDLEWSEGEVYELLGFENCGYREGIDFIILPNSWTRRQINKTTPPSEAFYHHNYGSKKYRLKLRKYDAW